MRCCIALLVGLIGDSADAADIYVPEQFNTICQAIAAAQIGDTINVGPGTYPGGCRVNKNVSIRGVGGPDVTFIDEQGIRWRKSRTGRKGSGDALPRTGGRRPYHDMNGTTLGHVDSQRWLPGKRTQLEERP